MLLVLPTLSAAFLLAPHPHTYRGGAQAFAVRSVGITACAAEEAKGGEVQAKGGEIVPFTPAQVEEVGNLVEDDEWLGLATELVIVILLVKLDGSHPTDVGLVIRVSLTRSS